MTDTMVLKAEQREVGSKHAAKVRAQGKLPCVVYGHKQESKAIAVEYKALLDALHHGHRLFEMEVDGTKETLLVQDVQFDHYGKDVIHADFMRVDLTEKVHVKVSIVLKGDAPGATKGGVIETEMDHVEMNCLVTSIPETIDVSIRGLEVGDSICAKDIKLPIGAELLSQPNAVIVHCVAKKKAMEQPDDTEESQEPEMIREKKTDDQE